MSVRKTPEEWEVHFGVTLGEFHSGWHLPFAASDALYSGMTRLRKDPREPIEEIEFLDRAIRCQKVAGPCLPPFPTKISTTC